MAELISTLGQSTLAAPYVAGSGSMVVASAASFPASGTFSIRVNAGAIYTVSGVAGTTLTVALEFGTDVNIASGSAVVEVVTARSLSALIAGASSVNYTVPFLNLGGGVVVGANAQMTIPNNAAYAWANQGGAAISVLTNGPLRLVTPADASFNPRIRDVAYPAAPFTYTVIYTGVAWVDAFASSGIVIRNSGSNNIITTSTGTNGSTGGVGLGINKWNNFSTFVSQYFGCGGCLSNIAGPIIVRFADDGVNRSWSFSPDGGASFSVAFSGSNTDFITPDRIGFFASGSGGVSNAMTVYSIVGP